MHSKRNCKHRKDNLQNGRKIFANNAILLLGIYLTKKAKSLTQKDTCTLMFIVALFTITKTWKQLVSNRGMAKEDVVHICNGIPPSHKKDEIMSFAATWMDLEVIILSEVSQTKTNIL